MSKTLIIGYTAKREIKKEQKLENKVLRIVVRKRPSGTKDVSFMFDNACMSDFVIRDDMNKNPLLTIDQDSLKQLLPHRYVINYHDRKFHLDESRI